MKTGIGLTMVTGLLLLPWMANAQTGVAQKGLETGATPVYVPPMRGAPSRRVGGSSRGSEQQPLPQHAVLAPDHVGLTTREQPVLYWFISKPTQVRLEITLIDDSGIKPLLDLPLSAVNGPAIHALDLAQHGIRLKPEVEYQWAVTIVPNPAERSGDIISSGAIKHVAAPPTALNEAIRKASTDKDRAIAYANAGLWYDAVETLGKSIAAAPHNRDLHLLRASLAEQVGLPDIAAFERLAPTH